MWPVTACPGEPDSGNVDLTPPSQVGRTHDSSARPARPEWVVGVRGPTHVRLILPEKCLVASGTREWVCTMLC